MTYALLSFHCSEQTEDNHEVGTDLDVKRIEQELKKTDDEHRKVNDYFKDWKILKIIEEEKSGYLGVIYINENARQLVLAHRSTNLKDS